MRWAATRVRSLQLDTPENVAPLRAAGAKEVLEAALEAHPEHDGVQEKGKEALDLLS